MKLYHSSWSFPPLPSPPLPSPPLISPTLPSSPSPPISSLLLLPLPSPILLQNCPKEEHDLIDFIIDHHGTEAGLVDYGMVRSLYRRGLVYFNIPISDEDLIVGE